VTPPPLEIADLIRSEGAAFIERNRQWIGWKHVKVLLAIARCRTPPHLAVISMSAPAAGIVPPFRTTAAITATARRVRLRLAKNGSRRVKRNCSPRATCSRLKGTMSEAELHVLRARLQGGILNKAGRGELVISPLSRIDL
jgi:hypothetical protein